MKYKFRLLNMATVISSLFLSDMMAAANSYVQDDSGTYIPATQRPDGSWRKARRVKEGYIPQDEMPLYESKGKQWAKNRPTLPVGLDPSYAVPAGTKTIPGLSIADQETTAPSKSSKKKKKKKSDTSAKMDEVAKQMGTVNISESANKLSSNSIEHNSSSQTSQQPITTDPAKRLRNLRKKIRDINTLKQKIDSGELPSPDKDQLEKIARKEAIEAEIEELELDLQMV